MPNKSNTSMVCRIDTDLFAELAKNKTMQPSKGDSIVTLNSTRDTVVQAVFLADHHITGIHLVTIPPFNLKVVREHSNIMVLEEYNALIKRDHPEYLI